jgi:probable phosphoglycerate mutase
VKQTRIILIRHAESEGNASSICECTGNSTLTARGEDQALRLAERLQALFPTAAALYSSPLRRAQRTAEIVAARLKLAVGTVADIREMHVGEWEGRPLSTVDLSPLYKNPDFASHGGESPRVYSTRTARALRELAEAHAGETVLAVGHGTSLSGALALMLEKEPLFGNEYMFRNTGFAELCFDPSPRLGEFYIGD